MSDATPIKEAVSTLLGFLIAPFVSAGLLALLLGFDYGMEVVDGVIIFLYFVSLAFTLIVALPVYFIVVLAYEKITWWSASLIGIVTGLVGAALFVTLNEVRAISFFVMPLIGGAAGLTFWSIWRVGHQQGTEEGGQRQCQ